MSSIQFEISYADLRRPGVAKSLEALVMALSPNVPTSSVEEAPASAAANDDGTEPPELDSYEWRFVRWISAMPEGHALVSYFADLQDAGPDGLTSEEARVFFPNYPGRMLGVLLGGIARWCEKYVGCPRPFKPQGPRGGLVWTGWPDQDLSNK